MRKSRLKFPLNRTFELNNILRGVLTYIYHNFSIDVSDVDNDDEKKTPPRIWSLEQLKSNIWKNVNLLVLTDEKPTLMKIECCQTTTCTSKYMHLVLKIWTQVSGSLVSIIDTNKCNPFSLFGYTSSYSQKDEQDVLSAKERTPNDIKWQNRKLGPSFIDQNFFPPKRNLQIAWRINLRLIEWNWYITIGNTYDHS